MTPIADFFSYRLKRHPLQILGPKIGPLHAAHPYNLRYGSAPPRKAVKFYCLRPCCENPGPKRIPQCYGTALNSNNSYITREVNSQNVFTCCSHVICGSEIDQYNYPGTIIPGFTQGMI